MKTERRQELNQNELAQTVNTTLDKFMPYWQYVAAAAVILFTVYFVTMFVINSQRKAEELGWSTFFSAKAGRSADALDELAATQGDSPVAVWAQESAAQARLTEACAAVHRDRAAAKEGFQSALTGFQSVLSASPDTLLAQRASWGVAQAHEGLNDLASAKQAYQKLVDTWPESALAEKAKDRLEQLDDPQTQEFYQWFYAQEPPKPKASAGIAPPSLPSLGDDVPTEPNFEVPDPTSEESGLNLNLDADNSSGGTAEDVAP